jgi:hypothetical protein
MRSTFSPAILPASLVAFRWLSLKYAGTVTTGLGHLLAEVVLGGLLHLLEDERRDLGRAVLPSRTSTHASPLSARTIL